jgi:hypothetical protein
VCKDVPTWNEGIGIKTDVSGNLSFFVFPTGYLPDIELDGVTYRGATVYDRPLSKMLVVADSKDLFNSWVWYMKHQNDKLPNPIHRDVYKWDSSYNAWEEDSTYRDTTIDNVVGLDSLFGNIIADVNMLKEKSDLIRSLGMNSSLNYLIQSRPGMGKTTLIRVIATYFNLNLHVVTHEVLANDRLSVETLLSRKGDKLDMAIFVFEDFDRYLTSSGKDKMASFLNALDGVSDTLTSIRFFTCNSKIEGEDMEAFLTRMRRIISIPMHEACAYMRSISIVFPTMADADRDTLVNLFREKEITMRRVNNLLCASLVYEDPIAYIRGQLA